MDLRKNFDTEKDLIKEGIWIDFNGGRFLVAYAGNLNPKWVKIAERVYKPHRYAVDHDILSEELAEELNAQIFVEAVLLDWQNVELDGEKLPYSRENAKRVLKEFPILWQGLREQATKVSNYRKADIETDSGN